MVSSKSKMHRRSGPLDQLDQRDQYQGHEKDEDNKPEDATGSGPIDPSPAGRQFQGLPLESLRQNVTDLAIQKERERIERTREQMAKEQD